MKKVSQDEERARDARLQQQNDRAPRHWLDPLVGCYFVHIEISDRTHCQEPSACRSNSNLARPRFLRLFGASNSTSTAFRPLLLFTAVMLRTTYWGSCRLMKDRDASSNSGDMRLHPENNSTTKAVARTWIFLRMGL